MNILIVDDESIILKGLQRLIGKWEDFHIIGVADDGVTALEWLKETDTLPDLILTDILMRYMDGLELIEEVRKLYPEIKCVILSGQEEFHLAQKAIDLHVSRYITKPVDPVELNNVLKKMAEEVQKEKEQRIDLLKKEQFAANTALYVRDKLLTDLLEGRLLSKEELEGFSSCFPFSIDEGFTTGVIRLVEVDVDQRNLLLNSVAVKQLFLETFLAREKGFVMFKDSRTLVFGIEPTTELIEEIKEFSSLALSVLGIQIILTIGQKQQGLLQLQSSVIELIEQLESRSVESFVYPYEEEQKLRVLLRAGKTEEGTKATASFLQMLTASNSSLESILQGCYKMIESVSSLFTEMGVRCPDYPPLSNVPLSTVLERIEKWMDLCLHERQLQQNGPKVEAIDTIITFMQEYYQDSSLHLQQLAEIVSLHPNHLTQLFRKHTGLSCMQYLAQVRMEKAKELLQQSDLKIATIAEQVGYENPLYFSTYFKKWVGLNPSDYKERLRKND